MTPENFAYWLQGYFEISEPWNDKTGLGINQLQVIKDHLKLVLEKKTPIHSSFIPAPEVTATTPIYWGSVVNKPELMSTGIHTNYPPASC